MHLSIHLSICLTVARWFDRRRAWYFDIGDIDDVCHVCLGSVNRTVNFCRKHFYLESRTEHAESSRPVIFRLFCRQAGKVVVNAVESTQCRRRWTVRLPWSPIYVLSSSNWQLSDCWCYATVQVQPGAVVSDPSPTPRSADATSRLIAPSATAQTPGRRQRRQACATTLATLLGYAANLFESTDNKR